MTPPRFFRGVEVHSRPGVDRGAATLDALAAARRPMTPGADFRYGVGILLAVGPTPAPIAETSFYSRRSSTSKQNWLRTARIHMSAEAT
jgi:hypothetical protein